MSQKCQGTRISNLLIWKFFSNVDKSDQSLRVGVEEGRRGVEEGSTDAFAWRAPFPVPVTRAPNLHQENKNADDLSLYFFFTQMTKTKRLMIQRKQESRNCIRINPV